MTRFADEVARYCPPLHTSCDRLFRLRSHSDEEESAEVRSGFMSGSHRFLGTQASDSDRLILVYVLRGQGRYTDASGHEHRLAAGSALMRWPKIRHRHQFTLDTDPAVWTASLPGTCADLLRATGADPTRCVLTVGTPVYLIKRITSFHEFLRSATDHTLMRAVALLYALYCDVWERAEQSPSTAPAWLAAVADHLARRPGDRSELTELAAAHGLAPTTFRRVFTQHMGESPGAYRIRRRIERAQSLLAETERPISDIADQLGYADVFAFSKQFKQRTGIPPAAFRKVL